jgi:hypothetical protein
MRNVSKIFSAASGKNQPVLLVAVTSQGVMEWEIYLEVRLVFNAVLPLRITYFVLGRNSKGDEEGG